MLPLLHSCQACVFGHAGVVGQAAGHDDRIGTVHGDPGTKISLSPAETLVPAEPAGTGQLQHETVGRAGTDQGRSGRIGSWIKIHGAAERAGDADVAEEVDSGGAASIVARAAVALGPNEIATGCEPGDEDVRPPRADQVRNPAARIHIRGAGEGAGDDDFRAGRRQAFTRVHARAAELASPDQVATAVELGDERIGTAGTGQIRDAGAGVEIHGGVERARDQHIPRAIHLHVITGIIAGPADAADPEQVTAGIVFGQEHIADPQAR